MPGPITMTRAQYQATYGAPPNVPPVPVQTSTPDQTPVQMTKAQYQSTYGQPAPTTSIQPDLGQSDANILQQAGQQAVTGFQETQQAVKNPNPVASVEGLIHGTGNEIGGGIRGIFAPLEATLGTVSKLPGASQALDAIKNYVINPTANAISDIPAVQNFIVKNPNAQDNIQNAITVAQTLIGGDKAPEVATTLGNAVDAGVSTVKETAVNLNPFKQSTEFTPEELQTHLQGVADDWAKVSTEPGSKYNNAKTILAKDPNIPTNLAQDGYNPFTHIDDQGNYDTKDAATAIRSNNGQLAQDNLRPALTTADYTTPKLQVSELSPTPDTTYGITPTMTKAVEAKINVFQQDLAEKYPNGMSLVDQLNEKINYDKNGGYNPAKPESENTTAVANRSMANSLSDNIKANVPENLGYDAFQKQLASRYRAADYLDALNGKKVPVSAKLNMIRMAAKFGGAALVRHIVPGMGDLITSFAGYQGGKMLETYIENLTNPMRDAFLQRMAQSNPEAVTGLQKYMSDIEMQRATQLKLPAPTDETILGGDKNPHILSEPTTYEAPAQKINRQPAEQQLRLPAGKPGDISPNAIELGGVTMDGYLIDNAGNKIPKPSQIQILEANKYGWSQDPKTGRFQKMYKSQ